MSGIKLDFVHNSLFEYVVVSANTGERQTRGNLTFHVSKCSEYVTSLMYTDLLTHIIQCASDFWNRLNFALRIMRLACFAFAKTSADDSMLPEKILPFD